MTPLIRYLEKDILPEDRNESRRNKKKAERCCISQGVLYQRSFSGPYLRCITPREATRILVELHEGDCGSHSSGQKFGTKSQKSRLLLANNGWRCQQASQILRRVSETRTGFQTPSREPQIHKFPWPFRKWGMDIVEEIPNCAGGKGFPPGGNRFLLKMGRSRSTQQNNRHPDKKVLVDERDQALWSPTRNCHRQWAAVHKP
ncbi:hypothetical protein Bca4012_020259 [Brassica carinata]